MWIVYKNANREIIGLTACNSADAEKQVAIAEIVNGTHNPEDISNYDAIQVTDDKQMMQYFKAFPDKLMLTATKNNIKPAIRDQEYFAIYATSDAPDKHPVDGIHEIMADGISSTVITLIKVDERKKIQNGKLDNDLLYLRTDYGIIRDVDNVKVISSIKLCKGEAKFRLVSETAKRVATVKVLSADKKLRGCTFRIEFI